ncbi:hypothetical protein [Bradyrhizobium sp. CCBAU 11357]|uniref:hypothetical protein n=1 Tax=Bradyrhizobium sp. CCBAU 11357 TaxID=1630808 RepID=UPI002303457D|nr:hypothetical protein [Bradyrhizobium sp. CCBAU 11357]MDA9501529.1 hypothetical protein [Bradyrhizobium sp. CCBAU 11357]
MARPEVTGCKPNNSKTNIDPDAYSVDEFCQRHRISRQLFYKLKHQGLMPVTFNLGTRVLISREAAAVWRRARERASQKANSAA